MSLQSFQSALAYVLRGYDPHQNKSIDELTRIYDLSAEERSSLDHVINQQQLKAYSEELFLARWTIIREAISFLQPFLDFKELTKLWEHDFEKKSQRVTHDDLALRFTDYLANDPVGQAFVNDATQPFVPSLVKYVNMIFTFKHNHVPKTVVPPHSSLTERPFAILNLDYDVRAYFADLMEVEDVAKITEPPPKKKPVTLLFVAEDEVCEFRSFEIDNVVANFLTNELQADHEHKNPRPPCYDDLVAIGICKGRAVKRACCDHH